MFGGRISEMCEDSGDVIPHIVKECVTYLSFFALRRQGLFRVSGVFDDVSALRTVFSTPTNRISLSSLSPRPDPHAVATVFKAFFAELADPVIPRDMQENLIQCSDALDQMSVAQQNKLYGMLISKLDVHLRLTLFVTLGFLYAVSRNSEHNLMCATNLGIVFGPNLMRCKGMRDITMAGQVTAHLIDCFPELQNYFENGVTENKNPITAVITPKASEQVQSPVCSSHETRSASSPRVTFAI